MYRSSRERDDPFGDPLPLNIYDAKAKTRRPKKGSLGKVLSSLCSVTGILMVLLLVAVAFGFFLRTQKAHLERVVLEIKREGSSAKHKLEQQNREMINMKAERREMEEKFHKTRDTDLLLSQMQTQQTDMEKALALEREKVTKLEHQVQAKADMNGDAYDQVKAKDTEIASLRHEIEQLRPKSAGYDEMKKQREEELRGLADVAHASVEVEEDLEAVKKELALTKAELAKCYEQFHEEAISDAHDLKPAEEHVPKPVVHHEKPVTSEQEQPKPDTSTHTASKETAHAVPHEKPPEPETEHHVSTPKPETDEHAAPKHVAHEVHEEKQPEPELEKAHHFPEGEAAEKPHKEEVDALEVDHVHMKQQKKKPPEPHEEKQDGEAPHPEADTPPVEQGNPPPSKPHHRVSPMEQAMGIVRNHEETH